MISPQPEERKNRTDGYNEPDEIDNAIHFHILQMLWWKERSLHEIVPLAGFVRPSADSSAPNYLR